MSENFMTVVEAMSRHCPLLVYRNFTVSPYSNSSTPPEMARAGSLSISESPTFGPCAGAGCMMWTWQAGSSSLGYCGLRGKVVIP